MTWAEEPLLAVDCETTGTDPETARIVSWSSVALTPTGNSKWDVDARTWLVAVDVDIPAEATAIHGITTEHAREHGRPIRDVLCEVTLDLADAVRNGVPVVGMNCSYDLTVLDRELRRQALDPAEVLMIADGSLAPVIDPYVIDKHVDPYRKGSRRLDALCATYQVRMEGAHDSTQDALAAARVAWRLAQRHPPIAAMTALELHDAQIGWAREQAESLRAYFTRTGKHMDALRVDGSWPIRPVREAAAT